MRNSFFYYFATFLSFMIVLSSPLLATKAPVGEELVFDQPSANRPRIIETKDISSCFINTLNDDIYRHIFSFLNQRDVPSVTRTSKRWKRLMEDNYLWQGYAQRAHLVMPGKTLHNKSYKALMRDHSIPSFTDLSVLDERMHIEAKSLSFDGSVIVGFVEDYNGAPSRAFRWTVEKGMESLGTLKGGKTSFARGISNNGSVIVGESKDGAAQNQQRAFRWTVEKGMESVEKLLADKGALPLGWVLTYANSVTPSGTVLVGIGDYTVQEGNGESKTLKRAWRAVIPRSNLF